MVNTIKEELHLGPAAVGGRSAFQAAWEDFKTGLKLYPIWSMLAWQDIRQRYRRSVLGPFWLTISTGIMVGTLGFLYAGLFQQEIYSYLPVLAVGLTVWGFIATVMNEACTVFVSVEGMMKQLRLPLTLHVCRMLWRNIIILAHNFIILVAVIIWAGTPITWELMFLPLALVIYCFNSLNIGLILGIACTRFRDIQPLIANLIQLLFFVTPIMWAPEQLSREKGGMMWIVDYNPAYHFIEIFRAPFLGKSYPPNSWCVVLIASIVLWVIAFWGMTKFRHRVAYWL